MNTSTNTLNPHPKIGGAAEVADRAEKSSSTLTKHLKPPGSHRQVVRQRLDFLQPKIPETAIAAARFKPNIQTFTCEGSSNAAEKLIG